MVRLPLPLPSWLGFRRSWNVQAVLMGLGLGFTPCLDLLTTDPRSAFLGLCLSQVYISVLYQMVPRCPTAALPGSTSGI